MSDPTATSDHIEVVRQLFVLWPGHATTERIEGYADLLADLRVDDLAEGCRAVAKVWGIGPDGSVRRDATLVPPVAVVRAAALVAARDRQIRAHQARGRVVPINAKALDRERQENAAIAMANRDLRRQLERIPTVEELAAELDSRGLHELAKRYRETG